MLERLSLARTNITDAGAQLLCNALQVRRLAGCSARRRPDRNLGRRAHAACARPGAGPAAQSNATLQAVDVSANDHMDASWQKLLDHVVKGRARA